MARCLESLSRSPYKDFETLVIDNASKDRSIAYSKNRLPWARFIEMKKNFGFGYAANIGVELSLGRYLVFMNYDIEVDPRWLGELARTFEEDKSVGGCGCKVLFSGDKNTIDCIGGFVCDIYASGLFPIGHAQADRGQYDAVREVFALPGLCMAVRREAFIKAGGFDGTYFLMGEDIDLSWRVSLAGYRIAVNPRAVVYHAGRDTYKKGHIRRKQIRYLVERNTLRTLLKNYGVKCLVNVLPKFLAMITAENFFFIFRGKIDWTASDLKAILWNIVNFPDTVRARYEVQKRRLLNDINIQSRMTRRNLRLELFRKFLCGTLKF